MEKPSAASQKTTLKNNVIFRAIPAKNGSNSRTKGIQCQKLCIGLGRNFKTILQKKTLKC